LTLRRIGQHQESTRERSIQTRQVYVNAESCAHLTASRTAHNRELTSLQLSDSQEREVEQNQSSSQPTWMEGREQDPLALASRSPLHALAVAPESGLPSALTALEVERRQGRRRKLRARGRIAEPIRVFN
jgi:hypothetical protein